MVNRMKRRVLFLCTGNSCRSQLAEAIVNSQMGDEWEAVSAGTRPTGFVHPKAVQALAEIGIDHHGRSTLADEFIGQRFDLVVTVCDRLLKNVPSGWGRANSVPPGFPRPGPGERHRGGGDGCVSSSADEIAQKIPVLLNDWANPKT